MEEQDKRRISNIKIGTVLIVCFLVIYIPSLLHWARGGSIATDVIRSGMLEDTVNTDAYIVRNEEVIKSPFDGTYIPSAAEGDRVPIHGNIATVLKKSSEKLLKQQKDLDLKIIKAQKKKEDNGNFFSQDIRKIDDDISEKLGQMIQAGDNANMEMERQLKSEINTLMQKKASILGGTGTGDSYVNSLMQQKQAMQSEINANTGQIISATPGMVSYYIDGLESALTPASIKNLTIHYLESLKTSSSTNELSDRAVEAQKPFVKVVKDFSYYLLVPVNKDLGQKYTKGDTLEIRMNEINRTMTGTIDSISSTQDGKVLLSVKLLDYLAETIGLRKTNVDLVLKHYDGLMVPVSSLINFNPGEMKAKIALVSANYATIKEVKVISRNKEFAIVENLDPQDKSGVGLYDIYVVKPKNIEEGQLINQ